MGTATDIMAAINLANSSYKGGYDEGWRQGFHAGLEAAKQIVDGKKTVDELLAEALAQRDK